MSDSNDNYQVKEMIFSILEGDINGWKQCGYAHGALTLSVPEEVINVDIVNDVAVVTYSATDFLSISTNDLLEMISLSMLRFNENMDCKFRLSATRLNSINEDNDDVSDEVQCKIKEVLIALRELWGVNDEIKTYNSKGIVSNL